jgi:hypothetical protein
MRAVADFPDGTEYIGPDQHIMILSGLDQSDTQDESLGQPVFGPEGTQHIPVRDWLETLLLAWIGDLYFIWRCTQDFDNVLLRALRYRKHAVCAAYSCGDEGSEIMTLRENVLFWVEERRSYHKS